MLHAGFVRAIALGSKQMINCTSFQHPLLTLALSALSCRSQQVDAAGDDAHGTLGPLHLQQGAEGPGGSGRSMRSDDCLQGTCE